MAKFSQLPTELWLDVASYLPKSQLLQLKSLNTVFFHCAMDIDWGHIAIDMMKPDQTDLVLARMADPFVASRTTSLSVRLRSRSTGLMPFSSYKVPSIISNMPFKRRESAPLEFASLMSQLFNVLPLLHNLTFLKLELLLIPLDLIQNLFRAITTSPFTRKIEKLSLTAHPDVIAPLVECSDPEITFANLSALDLILIDRDNEDNPKRKSDTNQILSLARFILSLSLQHLSIFSSDDVSPLFTRLTQPLNESSSLTQLPLPNLKSVMLTPVNFSFKSSPQAVHRFLFIHSANIQHLQLSLVSGPWPLYIEEDLEKWLSDFVNANGYDSHNDSTTTKSSPFFPNLQTLDIDPPDTPAGRSAMLTFIKQTTSTLSSLRIRCNLSMDKAKQVVSTLTRLKAKPSKRLRSLQMDMPNLTIPFIEFLAVKLPQLQKLYLRSSRSSQRMFSLMLENRRLYLSAEDDCLTCWKLRHLSIEGFSTGVVAALVAFIPSVVPGDEDESEDEDYNGDSFGPSSLQ